VDTLRYQKIKLKLKLNDLRHFGKQKAQNGFGAFLFPKCPIAIFIKKIIL
jgi:hypothetical protein